jgi:hypothetical protein
MYTFYVKSGEVMVVSKYNERYPENFIVFESLDARCTCKMAVAYLVHCSAVMKSACIRISSNLFYLIKGITNG